MFCVKQVFVAALFATVISACGNNSGDVRSGIATRPANASCVALALDDSGARAFPALTFNDVITGLYQQNNYWFVTTQGGLLARFENSDDATTYTTITNLPAIYQDGESGLLSMAFHPSFASNGYVYLSYTTGSSFFDLQLHITRYTLDGTSLTAPFEIFTLDQPLAVHMGGHIEFGPDGYLYAGFGDAGASGDPDGNGQNPATLHAKLLRIDVDGGTPYGIPADNPFVDRAGYLPEIFALGFRNPWHWSFDRLTGDIWLGDVGQDLWEEVNQVQAGGNYGWPITEGNHCFNGSSCVTDGLIAPAWEYSHDNGCAITGGFVYRGSALPELNGYYLYGDYCARGVKGFAINDPSGTHREIATSPQWGVTAFGQDAQGEILIGTAAGEIYRLTAGSTGAPAVPSQLSQHPCIADASSQKFTEGVIPYSVNSELWSDGAGKSRYVAIPDNETVSVNADDGDLIFPVGSVLIKQFNHNGRPVETRFLMHHASGWAGYSYEWDDNGLDARLSAAAHVKYFADGSAHYFPSSPQCFQCHTGAANTALGPETAQLNRDHQYGSLFATANQLDTWQHIGLFSAELSTTNRNRYMPNIDDTTATITDRARAYLHSNCSGCHRPGGYPSHFDLRFDTPFASMGVCNTSPAASDLGISGAKLLAPGSTALSLIYQRMSRRDRNQMPPLATRVTDDAALALIGQWIESIAACE